MMIANGNAIFPLMILDGGFGTTLEEIFHQDISVPLWSAKPVDKNPEVIVDAHLAFLRAGANVILTSTYQCAFSTFHRSGYSCEDAKRLMRKAVHLANEAKSRFLSEHPQAGNRGILKVALSLGPFGSTLSPAQEFDGFYPPPYGPRAYDPAHQNSNVFVQAEDEEQAIAALTNFHLERLRVFREDKETWDIIDWIAFETVPLTREIQAIRRAMGLLEKETGAGSTKPWWISTLYPQGQYPERTPRGEDVPVYKIAHALLHEDQTLATPDGIGVNCTDVGFLPLLLTHFSEASEGILSCSGKEWPWLLVYPNGGDTYDPATQTWVTRSERKGETWAKQVWDVIQSSEITGMPWRGCIVGGCCRTGPEEIEALVRCLKAES